VRVRLQVAHGVFKLIADQCTIMPPSRVMSTDQRIAWGMYCADYYDEKALSVWANTTLFRPDCPSGWTGTGTTQFPCIRLPLSRLVVNLTLYNPALLPAGQSHIPYKELEMEGTIENLQNVIQNNFEYIPDTDFNTVNLGVEQVCCARVFLFFRVHGKISVYTEKSIT
jgi:hypothetical protein